MTAGARSAPVAMVARQALSEGPPTRVRWAGGPGRGGGSVAEVRETPTGVHVWVGGFRVGSHADLAEFLSRWGLAESDLRDREAP